MIDKFLDAEVLKIKNIYKNFDGLPQFKEKWSPFNSKEAGYRAAQAIAFTDFMRKIGRVNLDGWKVLDVGCGNGRLLRSFVDMGARPSDLFGVEIRENDLSLARELSPQFHFKQTNGYQLDFQDGVFDLVTQFVVFSSIESIELQRKLAWEMWRVLKPGGYIFWWDLLKTAFDKKETLDLRGLFPNVDMNEKSVGLFPDPEKTLRSAYSRIFPPFLNLFKLPKTHKAALIGPKWKT